MSSKAKSLAQHMRWIADRLDRGEMEVSFLSIDKDYIDLSTDETNEVGIIYNSLEVGFVPLARIIDDGVTK